MRSSTAGTGRPSGSWAPLISWPTSRPSQMGDQAREVGFNEQKVPIVRDKYFIPYLIGCSSGWS